MSAANTRLVKHHKLVVRRDGEGYKAVVIGQGTLRLEGPAGSSINEALEFLLESTTEILEEASENWEGEGYPGEQVAEREDGSRIAQEVTPALDAGLNGDVSMGGEDVEQVANPKKRGRPRKSTAPEQEATPGKRGRGRPKKSIGLELATPAGNGDTPQKRKPGRPRKHPVQQESTLEDESAGSF